MITLNNTSSNLPCYDWTIAKQEQAKESAYFENVWQGMHTVTNSKIWSADLECLLQNFFSWEFMKWPLYTTDGRFFCQQWLFLEDLQRSANVVHGKVLHLETIEDSLCYVDLIAIEILSTRDP